MKALDGKWQRVEGGAAAVLFLVLSAPMAQAGISGLDASQMSSRPLEYSNYEKSLYGEFRKAVALVVNSPEEWDLAMQALDADQGLLVSPGRSSKDLKVNWSESSVILVSLGEITSISREIEIVGVECHGNRLSATLRITEVGPPSQVITSPYQIVLIKHGNWRALDTQYDFSVAASYEPQGRSSTAPASRGLSSSSARGSDVGPSQRKLTWSAVKDRYR